MARVNRSKSRSQSKGKPETNKAENSKVANVSKAAFSSTVSEQLIKDVASFSFAAPTGSKVGLETGFASKLDDAGIPGIMAIRWNPTIGWSDSATSPANLAARALMTRVRAANSGRRNYDQTALMLYILAVDSAYAWLGHMKRLYGMATTSSPLTKYLPEMLVNVAGCDYQDLIMNLADFRAYINTFAARLQSVPIPNIPVVARHMDMSANVYLDSMSGKAQMYLFVPEALYQYGFATTTSTGTLTLERPSYSKFFTPADTETEVTVMSVAQIKAFGEQLLQPILTTYGEEDFALMGGDILKAYGDNGVIRASGITEEYAVVPIYDELMLHRIMNSTAFGFNVVAATPSDNASFDVSIDVGSAPVSSFLLSKPEVVYAPALVTNLQDGYASRHILNSSSGAMDPATAIEALAFMTLPEKIDGTVVPNFTMDLDTIGTEYIVRYIMYFIDYSGTTPELHGTVSVTTPFTMVVTFEATTASANLVATNIGDARDKLSIVEQFDFHPILKPMVAVLDATDFTAGTWTQVAANSAEFLFGDVNDYTVITHSDLRRIRDIKTLVDLGL